jgi:plastocyanin
LTIDDEQARLDALEREFDRREATRAGWIVLATFLALLAIVASVIGIAFGVRAIDKAENPASPTGSIDAGLSEFAIALSADHVDEGGTIEVRNNGTQTHNLAVKGTNVATADLTGGGSATLDVSSLTAGSYEVYCKIPGHADAGMRATLHVGDATAAGAGHAGHDMANMTAEEGAAADQRMIESMARFPEASEGRGNQLLQPTVLADGTKHFDIDAAIVDWETKPGTVVKAWAYNGMVPGPRINLAVGDKVEVTVTNRLPVGTDIHWHGIDVPNGQDGVAPLTQDVIASGQTYTYTFTATEPAIGMYHTHLHGQEGVPNGLFGTMYVGDVPLPAGRTISGVTVPADLQLAQDFPMVLNDAGVIGLSLDGKSFPATAPVVAKQGDWLRVTYFNEGLQAPPMHLHGVPQLVVAKDGLPLDAPYAADTIMVAPGERYTVLIHADVAGTWVWHCHILNHVESADGMFGMVTALIVN